MNDFYIIMSNDFTNTFLYTYVPIRKEAVDSVYVHLFSCINLLKPNDIYICHTAALTSRRYILNIYSTSIHTEYFKHAA